MIAAVSILLVCAGIAFICFRKRQTPTDIFGFYRLDNHIPVFGKSGKGKMIYPVDP